MGETRKGGDRHRFQRFYWGLVDSIVVQLLLFCILIFLLMTLMEFLLDNYNLCDVFLIIHHLIYLADTLACVSKLFYKGRGFSN